MVVFFDQLPAPFEGKQHILSNPRACRGLTTYSIRGPSLSNANNTFHPQPEPVEG